MLLNFIKRKNMPPKKKAMDPIKEMLNQIWDLSRVFEAPDNTDEFDTIQTFNLYFKKLNGIVTAILKNMVSLAGLAPDLFTFSKAFKIKAEEQAEKIEEISQSTRNMARRLEETVNNTDNIFNESRMIEKEVETALRLGHSSMDQFKEIQSHVKGLVDTINILEDNSASITSITGLIHDIADETDILSLNARIEAARNSTGSKGFKVIAEEISVLAKQSQDAAKNIQGRLEILTRKIEETVEAVRLVEQNVHTGEKTITESDDALNSVHGRITELSVNMEAVKESIHFQSKEVNTISRDIVSMEDVVKQQAGEVQDIFKIAGQVNDTCDAMILETGIFHLSAHQKVRELAETAALRPEIRSTEQSRRETMLTDLICANPFIELAYMTDSAGIQITENIYSPQITNCCTNKRIQGTNWSAKKWFQHPVSTKTAFVSKVYRSSATQNFCFTISVPVFEKDTVCNVLALDVNFRDLLNI